MAEQIFRPYIGDKQLFWLEELPDYYVDIVSSPKGMLFEAHGPEKRIKIGDLPNYLYEHKENNLWRSWSVYSGTTVNSEIGPIPALLDIDDEPRTGEPNLGNACRLAEACLELIEARPDWCSSEEQIRIIFSGRKGFHIEFKPNVPLDLHEVRKQLIIEIEQAGIKRNQGRGCNVFFENTVLDTFKRFVRLNNSLNSWRNSDGKIQIRRVLQMSPDELRKNDIEDILSKADVGAF